MWYLLIIKVLREMGYTRSAYDPCIFYLKKPSGEIDVIIAVFVDDMSLNGNKESDVVRIKTKCSEIFKKITDMGVLAKFLGIEFVEDHSTGHLILTQLDTANQYIEEHLKNGHIAKNVPIAANHVLDAVSGKVDDKSDHVPIWDKVGQLRYLADRTRHDLLYVASKLGTKQSLAPPTYQKAALDAIAYLKATKDLGLRLGGRDKTIKLFGYADASFISDADSKSQLAFCFFLTRDSGAVCAKSMKDKTVSLSSTEAEIKALVEAIKEAIFLRAILDELGYPQTEATLIYQDNTSCIRLADKLGSEARTRHILNRINFIRESIANGIVRLEHIKTSEMVADVLTGPRERGEFEYLRGILLEGHWRAQRRG